MTITSCSQNYRNTCEWSQVLFFLSREEWQRATVLDGSSFHQLLALSSVHISSLNVGKFFHVTVKEIVLPSQLRSPPPFPQTSLTLGWQTNNMKYLESVYFPFTCTIKNMHVYSKNKATKACPKIYYNIQNAWLLQMTQIVRWLEWTNWGQ